MISHSSFLTTCIALTVRFMDWDYERKKYCKYWRSFGGTYKAPEEYDGAYLDETVDIWYVQSSLMNGSGPVIICAIV